MQRRGQESILKIKESLDVVSGEEKFCNDMNPILSTVLVGFEDSSNADIENETGRPLVATADPVTALRVAHAVPG
jgi:hypothetical protein